MKTKHVLVFSLLALTVVGPLPAQQTPPPSSPPPAPAPDSSPAGRGPGDPMAGLDEGEREKLKAARQKAMADPKVKAALEKQKAAAEEYQKTVRPLALAADPKIGPVLDKMEKAAAEAPRNRPPGGGRGGMMANLSPGEREQLRAVRDKLKDEAAFKTAEEKRHAADADAREAQRAAMLAADPSLQPVLDKIEKARARRGGGPSGPPKND